MSSEIKIVILDRDGVINHDSDFYIKSPDDWLPIPGSLQAIAALNAAGWTVSVATNQSGIARGLFDQVALNAIHDKMNNALSQHQAVIDYLVWCPHGPSDKCDCRKPATGLYRRIAAYFECSLIDVPVIGDSCRDLEAAIAVGARPILVTTGKGSRFLATGQLPSGTIVYPDLQSAVASLLATDTSSMS
jgi:D-glycero-D-manno-heptose 1,7-bisphosphate phosphatase